MSIDTREAASPTATARARWVYLKDLTLPPEMVQAMENYMRRFWFWERRRLRTHFENEFKLQHFFGGHIIRHMDTPHGRAVVSDTNGTAVLFEHLQWPAGGRRAHRQRGTRPCVAKSGGVGQVWAANAG